MRYEVEIKFTRRNYKHAETFGGEAPVQESARWNDNVQADTPEEAGKAYEANVRELEPGLVEILDVKVKEYEDGFKRSES